ncbi:MAG: F0F1 ATP synthase subunit A [Psychroflexus sp.]|nr:F0F1 ATP synthase subunit A [Psychroflexus sp.]MDN6309314.1 F0F1 ATP synthase subunit A [Psychroflexus sp.]
MQNFSITSVFLSLLVFTSVSIFAASGEGQVDTQSKINDFIDHHLQDSYDYTFFSDGETNKHYGFSLPIILIDNGLKVFSSSRFDHGTAVVEESGKYYKVYNSKIYETNAAGDINLGETGYPTNDRPLDFSITKNVATMFFVGILLILAFGGLARQYKKRSVPIGFGRVLEPLVLYVRDEIAIPNIGEAKYKKYMSYLLTVFFFIWLINVLGMTPLGVNVTGNIAVTACLALFTYFITQFSANKDYWKHIFWMPGVPIVMKIILIPIEILGTLTKPFALMIRLFANITAGHVIVMGLVSLIFIGKNAAFDTPLSVFLTLFLFVIEILVTFLQAYIFTMLSALFIGLAVEEHTHKEVEAETNEII